MTSIPASRSARAMIFAPRSCPSRPGLATTTRILRPEVAMPRSVPAHAKLRLVPDDDELLDAFEAVARVAPPGPELERLRALVHVQAGSEARRAALLDVAFDSVITMGPDGVVVDVNRAAEKTFG